MKTGEGNLVTAVLLFALLLQESERRARTRTRSSKPYRARRRGRGMPPGFLPLSEVRKLSREERMRMYDEKMRVRYGDEWYMEDD